MNVSLGKLFYTIALKGKQEFQSDLNDTEKKTESSSDKLISAFKKIGAGIATYFTIDAIKNFGQEIVNVAAEIGAEASAFEQIMGDYSDHAKSKMNELADETGMVSTRLTPYMTSMTAKFKGLGYDIDDATTLATDGLELASDAAAFWDQSLDESVSHLNSFINGSYEGGEAIGLFANDTQMAQFAIQEGLVASSNEWSKLDEATKQATRLEYAKAMFEQSGATGQAAKESEQYANVQANLAEKWRQFKAQIGEPLLQNIVIPAMEKLSGIVDFLGISFQNLSKFYQENKFMIDLLAATVGGFVLGLGTYKLALMAVEGWQKLVTLSQNLWNAAQNASPHMLLVAGIMAIVGAFIYLWNNSEAFREFWLNLWEQIKTILSTAWEFMSNAVQTVVGFISSFISGAFETIKTVIMTIWNTVANVTSTAWNFIKNAITNPIEIAKSVINGVIGTIKSIVSGVWETLKSVTSNAWNAIKTAITSPIEAAKNVVKGVIDAMKGFFNFNWELPKIKLPHFSVTGSANPIDWLTQGIPKISVEWYAKGGILEKPTIFGANGPNLMAGGEAGPEAVAPISKLMDYVRIAVDDSNQESVDILNRILKLLSDKLPQETSIVLDSGVLVGKLAPGMDEQLGIIRRRKGR